MRAGLTSVEWWAVARSDDGLTIVVMVDLTGQAIRHITGVDVLEADDSVTINILGESIPADMPRALLSLAKECLIGLTRPIGARQLLHP